MNPPVTGRKGEIKSKIEEILCDLSGLEEDDLIANGSFLELGFDSLFLTQLAAEFQKCFSIEITFRQLMRELNSVSNLMEFLDLNLPEGLFEPDMELPDVTTLAADNKSEPLPPPSDSLADKMTGIQELASTRVSGSAVSEPVQAVMKEQLRLMSLQLSMLQGSSKAADDSAAANPSAATNRVVLPEPEVAPDKPIAENDEPTPVIKLPPGFGPQVDGEAINKSLGEKQHHLDELIAAYSERTKSSKESTQKYRTYHADPRTAAGFNPLWKEIVYPIVIQKSKGSRLWDIDGNEYIDLLNGFGPNFLGHAPDYVQEALHEQIDNGFELGPQTPFAGEVAKMICEMTGLDRATFVNTGSEAVQAAIRVARTVTGKEKIVVFSQDYHGNFDEVLVRGANSGDKLRTLPLAPGIPRSAVENILVLDYGEDHSLEIIEQHAGEIAAVLIEPVQSRRPDFRPRRFVQRLRALTEDKNIAFVFDEVITGFRTGLGGAQEYFKVAADLVTYGKVLGGGMPIGVVAGKSRYMNTFDGGPWQYGDDSFPEAGVTFFAGTFLRHPLAIVASHASLNFLKAQGPELYKGVYEKTSRLAAALNQLFQSNGINIHVAHFSSQMYFRIEDENDLIELLFYHARMRGLYMLEGFPSYLTVAHTDDDIDRVIQIFDDSITAMQKGGIIALPRNRETKSFPLTASQTDVWVASQLSDTASCAYNESDTVKLTGSLDEGKLKQAIKMTLSRHQSPNLSIDAEGQGQRVDWQLEHEIETIDLSQYADTGAGEKLDDFYEERATTPFYLEKGPLIKLYLIKLSEDIHLLVVYGHHIAFDGWSSSVLLHEIGQLYSVLKEQRDLKLPSPLGFNEYVEEERRATESTLFKIDLEYWQACYPERVPLHNLPLDYERGKTRNFEGATLHYEYGHELLEAIRRASSQAGVTVHNFLLAGFVALLHQKSRDTEFVIGIPTAGQMHASNDCLVGYCVNLLPLKQGIDEQQSIGDLLESVRDNVLDAFEHQYCGYSELLNKLPVSREPGRSPLVELVFNYSSYFDELEYAGLEASVYENPRRAVVFDMFLNIVEMDGSLHLDWDFSSELFSLDTMELWAEELGSVYQKMVQEPQANVQQLIEVPSGSSE
jgi:glutamate-1-semialdehyde aminotransferase/acyl carrier protein